MKSIQSSMSELISLKQENVLNFDIIAVKIVPTYKMDESDDTKWSKIQQIANFFTTKGYEDSFR